MTESAPLRLRLPASTRRKLEDWAARESISMNQFVVTALIEKLTALETAEALTDRRIRDWLRERSKLKSWVFPG